MIVMPKGQKNIRSINNSIKSFFKVYIYDVGLLIIIERVKYKLFNRYQVSDCGLVISEAMLLWNKKIFEEGSEFSINDFRE